MSLAARAHWIFDMDGTLTVAVHDFAAIKRALGLPEDQPILEVLAELPPSRSAPLHARLVAIETDLARAARPAVGAAASLEALRARGCRLGVLTRNTRALAEVTLRAAGLWGFFEPAVVLGNSLGGLVAARVALERPERVLALALVSPAGAPMTRGALADFLAPFDFADYGQALRFVDRFLARRSWLRFPLAWGVRVRMGRPGVRDLIARMRADQFLEAGELAALAAPSLLYWGRADHILPPHHLDFWRAHLPGVAVITPSAIGHAPYLDDLDGFAREVAAWARAAVGEEDSA